jgi:hypothetical protein
MLYPLHCFVMSALGGVVVRGCMCPFEKEGGREVQCAVTYLCTRSTWDNATHAAMRHMCRAMRNTRSQSPSCLHTWPSAHSAPDQ